ncbi:hypothetical protein GGF46_005008 [Coemansia sp. RSA 552]|nr:hypothetical protein GGF46_005008 [Coemansia sp. RSA 552]
MKSWPWVLLLLVAVPVKGDLREDVDKLAHVTLVRDGKPTNCAASLISTAASAVAASCLNFTSSGSVDKDITYDVYVNDSDGIAATSFRVKRVTVHPKYNPENHVNNIAVLEYDRPDQPRHPYIQGAHYMGVWTETAFGQKYLVDVEKNQWSDLAFSTFNWSVTDTCRDYSQMYSVNQDYLICQDNPLTTDLSPNNLGCSLPVGATYGSFNGTTVMTSLYSYAVLDDGNDICSAKSYRVYYTALYLYQSFFAGVVGHATDAIGELTTNLMVDRDFEQDKDSNRTFVGRGFTQKLGAETEPESSSEDSLMDAGDSESSADGGSAGGLSRQAVIAIAVCVPVIVLLLLGIGLWFYCRRRNRHRYDGKVSPITSDHYQDMLVVEQPAEAPVLETSETGGVANPVGSRHASANRWQPFTGDDLNDLPPQYDDAAESNNPSAAANQSSTSIKSGKGNVAADKE